MTIPDDVTRFTTEQAEALHAALEARLAYSRIEASMDALSVQAFLAAGVYQGDPWVQPVDAATSYPLDWTVQHDGRRWRSTGRGNITEPGTPGARWEEYQPVGGTEPPTEQILALIEAERKHS